MGGGPPGDDDGDGIGDDASGWLREAEAQLPKTLIPLGSKLATIIAHLSVHDICADDGYLTIIKHIKDNYECLKDQDFERAFDEAVFKGRRERGQVLNVFSHQRRQRLRS